LTEEQGIWKRMDDKSVFRKVGQALREQQVRQAKDVNEGSGETTMDKPSRIINIAPPVRQGPPTGQGPPAGQGPPVRQGPAAEQGGVSLNHNSKRGRDDFLCNIRNAHKLPKIGERDTHKAQTQQYQIGVVKDELGLLREQVLLLSKKVSVLENQNIDPRKAIEKDPNLSRIIACPNLVPKVSYTSVDHSEITQRTPNSKVSLPHGYIPPPPPGNFSPDAAQSGTESFREKPSLRVFSQNLALSMRGISKLDNAEAGDFLYAMINNT